MLRKNLTILSLLSLTFVGVSMFAMEKNYPNKLQTPTELPEQTDLMSSIMYQYMNYNRIKDKSLSEYEISQCQLLNSKHRKNTFQIYVVSVYQHCAYEQLKVCPNRYKKGYYLDLRMRKDGDYKKIDTIYLSKNDFFDIENWQS